MFLQYHSHHFIIAREQSVDAKVGRYLFISHHWNERAKSIKQLEKSNWILYLETTPTFNLSNWLKPIKVGQVCLLRFGGRRARHS